MNERPGKRWCRRQYSFGRYLWTIWAHDSPARSFKFFGLSGFNYEGFIFIRLICAVRMTLLWHSVAHDKLWTALWKQGLRDLLRFVGVLLLGSDCAHMNAFALIEIFDIRTIAHFIRNLRVWRRGKQWIVGWRFFFLQSPISNSLVVGSRVERLDEANYVSVAGNIFVLWTVKTKCSDPTSW